MKPIENARSPRHWLLFLSLYLGVAISAHAAPCEPWAGRVVSLQGSVLLLRANGLAEPVSLQQTLCPGDHLSVGQNSRAEVLLPNETVLRLDEDTVFNLVAPSNAKRSWVELVRGVVHFLSRVHGTLDIRTPFINATIEGTELVLKVDDRETQLWVLEGKVRFANEFGSLQVNTGQSAAAEKGKAPVYRLLIKPRDAVQWALYYPPIIDYRSGAYAASPASRYLDEAIAHYRQGDLSNALSQLERAPPEYRDNHYFAVHAALLLSSGRVDEANQDITEELRLRPNDATPHALRAIIALAQNRKDEALTEARRATELEPNSPIGHIALSYAQQAAFNLDKATESTQRAITLAPGNTLAHARLAELELSRGYRSRGIAAARKAARLEPRLARTHTVLGFAYLTEIKIDEAKLAFERAIHLDSTDPLARLGLGLAKIRKGKLQEGTEELELATSLDPNNSLIRSYLGKAYYEQRRPKIAETEFKNAKELDPKDPTPYFYDAIHKQTTNRPVEALRNLQKAIALNKNRTVYRSKLLLDDDLAARSASLARVYRDLGFEQLALVEGWKSVNTDPGNYSAHRLLADSYTNLQRHEIARVSELLQSQLLQPINVTPVQLSLAERNLLILNGGGPSTLAFNEFNPLFMRNRLALQVSGIFGSDNTYGDEVVQSGLWDNFSYSAGQFHYQTKGFRENDDLKQDIYNIFVQGNLSQNISIQAEARHREVDHGDLRFNFDLTDFNPFLRRRINTDTVRIGVHYAPTKHSDLIASIIYQDDIEEQRRQLNGVHLDTKAYSAEAQYLFNASHFALIAGGGYYDAERKESFSDTRPRLHHANGYLYNYFKYPAQFTWILGVGVNALNHGELGNFERVNPKFGLIWDITPYTSFRLAAFRTLKRPFVIDQTIEPTQIAGFNQLFDDADGTEARRYGAALDHKFSQTLFGGIEVSKRELKTPFISENKVSFSKETEELYRAYINWTPNQHVAITLGYQREHFRSPDIPSTKTQIIPLSLGYFHPSGFLGRLGSTYVTQESDDSGDKRDDAFVLVDAGIGYRLPRRYGIIRLDVKNLFDQGFSFQGNILRTAHQEENPLFLPTRTILAQITLAF